MRTLFIFKKYLTVKHCSNTYLLIKVKKMMALKRKVLEANLRYLSTDTLLLPVNCRRTIVLLYCILHILVYSTDLNGSRHIPHRTLADSCQRFFLTVWYNLFSYTVHLITCELRASRIKHALKFTF